MKYEKQIIEITAWICTIVWISVFVIIIINL